MASFASSATTCGARKHAWTNNDFIHIKASTKATKNAKTAPTKAPQVTQENYKENLIHFLNNFKEKSTQNSKYYMVAKNIVEKGYNMFHVLLKDIKTFNPNLCGFLRSHYQTVSREMDLISKEFIEDCFGVGVLKSGVYFVLNTTQ